VLTLDSGAWIDFIPSASSPWKFSPGLFYHHQDGFWAGGLDLAVRRSLFEDNSALLVSYSFRGAVDKQKRWDARPAQFDHQFSHTLLVSWTQYLSKSWVGNLGIQLAHQSGQLGSALNYVTVFDQDAIPRRLVDEDLPRRRSRMQLIGRVRYSPWVKYSIGMDASYYLDDWGIHHESMQPSVELPLVWDIRLRLWYRLALQQASTYFTSQPTNDDGFHTQDSDLGRFVMHNPGLFLNIPLREPSAGKLGWDTRLSAFGFYRDDDIYAIGANMGVVTRW